MKHLTIFLLLSVMTNSTIMSQNKVSYPKEIAPINAPFEMDSIQKPLFPERKVVVKMKRKRLSTKVIQQTIDYVSKQGGGTVIIPKGIWKTGRIVLKNNINLYLEKDAELHFSGEVKDYQPAVFTRNEGVEMMSLGACVYANDALNIAITGEGSLIGPGRGCEIDTLEKNDSFLDKHVKAETPVSERLYDGQDGRRFFRPVFVGLMNCENVLIEGISMTNTIFWNIVPEYCNNVIIRGVTIDSHGTPRGDAVDIESTRNVLIEYCWANTTDDAYTMKAGRGWDGLRVNQPTENVVIRHCYAKNSAGGVTVGSETGAWVRNVYVHDCTFEEVQRGAYLKSRRIRGGGGCNIIFERIHMIRPRFAFFCDMLGSARWVGELANRFPQREITPLTPEFHDVSFTDITVEDCELFIQVKGLPELPIRNVTFQNVMATGRDLMKITDMKDFKFDNVKFNGLTIDWK